MTALEIVGLLALGWTLGVITCIAAMVRLGLRMKARTSAQPRASAVQTLGAQPAVDGEGVGHAA